VLDLRSQRVDTSLVLAAQDGRSRLAWCRFGAMRDIFYEAPRHRRVGCRVWLVHGANAERAWRASIN
jgi:hypothetical protein